MESPTFITMPHSVKSLLAAKLSPRACALISIAVLLLYCLGWAAIWELHRVRLAIHLRQAIPMVRAETTRELQLLTRAIDDYKKSVGSYPPDHVLSQNPPVVDSVTNQLLYELFGTVHDRASDTYSPPGFPGISTALARQFFNVPAFRNSGTQRESIRQFIRFGDIPATMAVSQKPDVGVLAFFPNWEGCDPELLGKIPLSPWQYNSSAPVHNRDSYDLWIQVTVSGSNIVVGNW